MNSNFKISKKPLKRNKKLIRAKTHFKKEHFLIEKQKNK